MPLPQTLQKAYIQEVANDGSATGAQVEVQFNPQSLKVSYSNQFSGGEQPQGQSRQFIGTSVTKLSMELWFDVTLSVRKPSLSFTDVRKATERLIVFLKLKDPTDKNQTNRVPPNLKFQWGSFLFTGTMDSLDETIDLFSPEGVPLRASVSISITKHDLSLEPATPAAASSNPIGTTPLATAISGDSVSQLAAQAGISDWQSVARANGIDNPRTLQPGTLIDLSISA
jgi:hypothetical protein